MFGRDALLSQVMEEMGDELYKEALEVEHIEPMVGPTWRTQDRPVTLS
jgi:hypothetical protein